MPEKVTTAPISVRPLVIADISRAMSKSSSWMRMVTMAVMGSSQWFEDGLLFEHDLFGKPVPTFPDHALAAGHRREERNLAGAGDRRIRLDMGVVDRGADHLRLFERVGIGLAALRKPGDQVVDGAP